MHWQLPGLELHYVNLIEVTAPGLDMKFLDTKVRPYLEHSFSGEQRTTASWQARFLLLLSQSNHQLPWRSSRRRAQAQLAQLAQFLPDRGRGGL